MGSTNKNSTCAICDNRLQSKLGKTTCRACLKKEKEKLVKTKFCAICQKEIPNKTWKGYEDRKVCSNKCSFKLRKGRKHTELTKQKIAIGNSKPCTPKKAKKISEAKKTKISIKAIKKLKELWDVQYVTDKEIMSITGIKGRVYRRLKHEHCMTSGPIKFLPRDLRRVETEKIIQLAGDGVHYKDIAKFIGRGHKQTENILNKLDIDYVRQRPRVSMFGIEPKTEKYVREWLEDKDIDYKQWHYLSPNSKWEYDFWIVDTNILLEVNGDYWHCNPKVYVNGPINEWQKTAQRRDYLKRQYAKDMGYHLIYIWEKSINENDYHAFNRIKEQIKNELNIR
ncbi:hypothetical protein CMI47_08150 [Candidatus Pacearchaeota archaeon]|nr:hypothetical protein [Candidatus Pacearchaeota archaeon]|tara:strand:- start:5895 stop:6908 length:1014 start_codon:yes stop_codon:yes gene_type:complete